jgi:hypothetical protein
MRVDDALEWEVAGDQRPEHPLLHGVAHLVHVVLVAEVHRELGATPADDRRHHQLEQETHAEEERHVAPAVGKR